MENGKRMITISVNKFNKGVPGNFHGGKLFITRLKDAVRNKVRRQHNTLAVNKSQIPAQKQKLRSCTPPLSIPTKSQDSSEPRCFICSLKCETKLHLLMHLNCAHEICLYKCGFCDQKFMTMKLLEDHVNNHIGTVVPPGEATGDSLAMDDDFQNDEEDVALAQQKDPGIKTEGLKEADSSGGLNLKEENLPEITESPPNPGFDDYDDFYWTEEENQDTQTVMETSRKKRESGPKFRKRAEKLNEDRSRRKSKSYNDRQMCEICGDLKKDLRSHVREVHDHTAKCPRCNMKLSSDPKKEHLCNTKRLNHLCKCGEIFVIREDMTGHVLEHNSPDHEITCHRCELTFRSFKDLNAHAQAEHPNPFLCSSCPKSFVSKDLLAGHMLSSHILTTPIKCDICGRICYGKIRLKRHLEKVHTAEHKIVCSVCGIVCRDKYTYQRHVNVVHNKTLDFECKVCKRGFGSQAGLRYHLASHTGERKYPCPFCSKGFKINAELRKHYRSAHRDVTIKCPSCTVYCLNEAELKMHLNRYPAHNTLNINCL